jgi:hypothetical protein
MCYPGLVFLYVFISLKYVILMNKAVRELGIRASIGWENDNEKYEMDCGMNGQPIGSLVIQT